MGTLHMKWDNGRSLGICPDVDSFEVIKEVEGYVCNFWIFGLRQESFGKYIKAATQGSEKNNYNNHPFEGSTDTHTFALAHNGVLYNDKELRKEKLLLDTVIETDTYITVQLIEHEKSVDSNSIKTMAEAVTGSFVFTILRDDNTLFLVKGNNPMVGATVACAVAVEEAMKG